jgi:rare lipoprotein A
MTSCGTVRYERYPARTVSPPSEQQQTSPQYQELHGEQKQVIASWYGSDFHGKPTASGEIFNMYAMTCAHKEYPFGTKLKVVNPQNNKDTECLVNDRGPFIAGRDIDLSYAAAKQIELIGKGTGPVIIEPISRDMRYVKYIRYGDTGGQITIQIGSFKDADNARRLKMALELKYKNVYIMEADIAGVRYHRVRIGKFGTKTESLETAKALANEGYDTLITKFEQQI